MSTHVLPESQMGPAERLLDVVLGASAHLWHNRPGLDVGGTWQPGEGRARSARARHAGQAGPVRAGGGRALRAPARDPQAQRRADGALRELRARRDRLARPQGRVRRADARAAARRRRRSTTTTARSRSTTTTHRRIGEAMVLWYQKKSPRMLTPKAVLRVAELLETPEIAALNRAAGFGDPAAKRAPLGRWTQGRDEVARAARDEPPMLEGLVQGRLQGDDQEPRAQGRLQAAVAGVLRRPRLEAEAGGRRPPRDRSRQRDAREVGAVRRSVGGGDLRDDRRRSACATRTPSAGCRRTSA